MLEGVRFLRRQRDSSKQLYLSVFVNLNKVKLCSNFEIFVTRQSILEADADM